MATTTVTRPEAEVGQRQKLAIIDCDIHNSWRNPDEILPYLPGKWHAMYHECGMFTRAGQATPRSVPYAARKDSWVAGGLPGSDLEVMRRQLLDEFGIEFGVLNCLNAAYGTQNLELIDAVGSALNDWQIAEWLEPEPRLRASLLIPWEDADLSVAEIERLGDHPGYVQVMMVPRTIEPLGRRRYWKIYAAAQEYQLPIGLHFGGLGVGPMTGGGQPSHYIEDHAGMAQAFQAAVTSLVYEGVFEQFPDLKVVLVEGGFAWLPPLMWRLDSCYRRMSVELPRVERLPSEQIREHIYLSTQPMEEPPRPEYLEQVFEHMGMDGNIMFATDYPHWDFDSPRRAIPTALDPVLRRKIMSDNARALYRLGDS